MTIKEKREKLVELHNKLTSLHDKGVKEERELTKDENTEFDSILNESDSLREEISNDEKRAAQLGSLNEYLQKPVSEPQSRSMDPQQESMNTEEKSEYRNLGEWFNSEKRTMSMGNAGSGGIMVPDQFKNEILSLNVENNIFRPRATIIEAGNPPDSKITIPIFNQMGTNGIYGGMSMQWIDEGGTKSDQTPEFSYVELEPKEIGGSTIITDKLLRNAPALSSWLRMQYGKLVNGKEDYAFLRGNGVGQPVGLIGCAGEKTVTRTTASTIGFADVSNMLMNLLADSWGSAVWIASQSILTQLTGLVDTAGNTLFLVGDATKKIPATLFGIPIIFTGKTPTLGNKGDLILADLSYYLIKEGSGPYFASSEHVYFTTNKTVVKMFKNVDGAPWVKSTLLLEDSTTTVSPIVTLV